MNALGMIEVFGFTTAVCTADVAAKAADVRIIAFDRNKPAAGDAAEVPLVMLVKMEGEVGAVNAAMEAGVAYAKGKGLYITSHVIARPGPDVDKMAYRNDIGKDKLRKVK